MPKLHDPRIVKIFFSSPFGGMEDEREELTRRYFPHIQHLCNAHGLQFAAVDMRWGITAESSENSQVINICLRELDRSDMFIGFFGQRYGWHGTDDKILQQNFDNAIGLYPWVDKFRDKSVTELEFLHGFLNDPGKLPAAILFRDKSYDDAIREEAVLKGEKKQVFKYSAESELSTSLINDLKDRVWTEREKCLGVHMNYKTPAEAAKIMFDTIMEFLKEKVLADMDLKRLTQEEERQSQHDAFLASRCNVYVHGDKYMAQLNKTLNAEERRHILVTGLAGSGKSALLCNWIASLKQQPSQYTLFYHFIGFAESSSDSDNILRRMSFELEKCYRNMVGGTSDNTPQVGYGLEEGYEKRDLMQRVIQMTNKICSLGKTLVIVLDGLDKITATGKITKVLYWLPSNFPSQCMVVLSTIPTDTQRIKELESRNYLTVEIDPLMTEAQHEMSVKTLKESGKELSPSQLERIVTAKMTKLPLYLKITLTELVSFGYFRLLDQKIDSLISSVSVAELFQKVLQRLEEDYNVSDYSGNLVEQVMCSISLSHIGLSETELKEIFSIPDHVWSPLYFAIERLTMNHSGFIQFGFIEFKEAVKEKYLSQTGKKQIYLNKLIKYFDEQLKRLDVPWKTTASRHPVFELPWLWVELGDLDGLANCLSNSTVFSELEATSLYELVDMWQQTGLTGFQIADRLIKTFDDKVAQLYVDLEQKGLLKEVISPGIQLCSFLSKVEQFLEVIGSNKARKSVLLRKMKCLTDGLEHVGVSSEEKENVEESLIYCKYRLACAKCEIYKQEKEGIALHEEIIQHLKRKSDLTPSEIRILGFSCNGMAVGYMSLGDYDKVLEYCEQSVHWHKQTGYSDSLSHIAGSYSNIGLALMQKEECEKALPYFDRSIEAYEEYHYGETPPVIGEILTNKGICLRKLDRLEEAGEVYQKSLEMKVNAVGRNHDIVAMAYLNLSALEVYRHNHEKSKHFCKQALDIYEALGDPWTKINYICTWENLLNSMAALGQFEEMEGDFKKIFDWRTKDGSMDGALIPLYKETARYYLREQIWDEAYKILYALLDSKAGEEESTYILINIAVANLPPSFKANLPKTFTLSYAVEKFPESVALTKQLVEDYLVPAGDEDEVARLVNRLHSLSPDMAEDVYLLTLNWCLIDGKMEEGCQQRILQEGLIQYPDNLDMMLKLSMSYRQTSRPDLAVPLAVKVAEKQLDNPNLIFFTAQTAAMASEMGVCRKYCQHLLDTCSDEEIQQKVNKLLELVEAAEATSQDDNQEGTAD